MTYLYYHYDNSNDNKYNKHMSQSSIISHENSYTFSLHFTTT